MNDNKKHVLWFMLLSIFTALQGFYVCTIDYAESISCSNEKSEQICAALGAKSGDGTGKGPLYLGNCYTAYGVGTAKVGGGFITTTTNNPFTVQYKVTTGHKYISTCGFFENRCDCYHHMPCEGSHTFSQTDALRTFSAARNNMVCTRPRRHWKVDERATVFSLTKKMLTDGTPLPSGFDKGQSWPNSVQQYVCGYIHVDSIYAVVGCVPQPPMPAPPTFNAVIVPISSVIIEQPPSPPFTYNSWTSYFRRINSTFEKPTVVLKNGSEANAPTITLTYDGKKRGYDPSACGSFPSPNDVPFCPVILHGDPGEVCVYRHQYYDDLQKQVPDPEEAGGYIDAATENEKNKLGCIPRPGLKQNSDLLLVGTVDTKWDAGQNIFYQVFIPYTIPGVYSNAGTHIGEDAYGHSYYLDQYYTPYYTDKDGKVTYSSIAFSPNDASTALKETILLTLSSSTGSIIPAPLSLTTAPQPTSQKAIKAFSVESSVSIPNLQEYYFAETASETGSQTWTVASVFDIAQNPDWGLSVRALIPYLSSTGDFTRDGGNNLEPGGMRQLTPNTAAAAISTPGISIEQDTSQQVGIYRGPLQDSHNSQKICVLANDQWDFIGGQTQTAMSNVFAAGGASCPDRPACAYQAACATLPTTCVYQDFPTYSKTRQAAVDQQTVNTADALEERFNAALGNATWPSDALIGQVQATGCIKGYMPQSFELSNVDCEMLSVSAGAQVEQELKKIFSDPNATIQPDWMLYKLCQSCPNNVVIEPIFKITAQCIGGINMYTNISGSCVKIPPQLSGVIWKGAITCQVENGQVKFRPLTQ